MIRRGNLFWGFILIVLGGLFLLQAAGLIQDVLGWFWPIGLILLGIWVLAGRYMARSAGGGETFSIDLQGAARIDLEFNHGAGSVFIGAGAASGIALSGLKGTAMEVTNQLNSDRLGIDISAGPSFLPFLGPEGGEWRFQLNQDVPVAIKVDAGASSLNFDMTEIKLMLLSVDTGASSVRVKLPSNAGHTLVDIQSGAASIDLFVPSGVGARIRLEQGASSINIDEKRFPASSSSRSLYQSEDYDIAPNKVEINLEGGANSVNVH